MTQHRYLAFNKPFGVLSTFTDAEGRPTLKQYIDVKEVYSAGRLDFDSEGLLLLTTDGNLIHELTDPQHHLEKTYLVQVEGIPQPEQLGKLQQGVNIQGYHTQRCKVIALENPPSIQERSKPIKPHGPTQWLRMVLREGKKRQIRHMTAAVGLPTLRIVRIAIGPIGLGELQPGEWRDLSKDEVALLRSKSRTRKQV